MQHRQGCDFLYRIVVMAIWENTKPDGLLPPGVFLAVREADRTGVQGYYPCLLTVSAMP